MTVETIIKLEQLHCIRKPDTNQLSEPYIWPVLLWTDDGLLASRELVGVTAPANENARVIIKNDMRAGESADIPPSVGVLSTQLDSTATLRRMILAVAILEKDEAPESIIQAGFEAFYTELRAAAADNLLELVTADQMEDADEKTAALNVVIEKIKPRVVNRVKSAIEKNLTGWQKTRALAKSLKLDNFIGCDFINFSDPLSTSTNLTFRPSVENGYEIQGSLELNAAPADPS